MIERGAELRGVVVESPANVDASSRSSEFQDKFQLRPRKRVRAIGALTASVLALGITLTGCSGGNSASVSETPSISPSPVSTPEPSPLPSPTPSPNE